MQAGTSQSLKKKPSPSNNKGTIVPNVSVYFLTAMNFIVVHWPLVTLYSSNSMLNRNALTDC